ncbi:hypothetical protein B0H14DRAFT_3479933 [Mycena olivaceomarginata]|nr:hypothetical protein B0H14DRAFT_3479933 [Mycena olivaceomarginata]
MSLRCPSAPNHSVFLREDMRFGEDDPTLWPQDYSSFFCHLGAIRRKLLDTLRKIAIMWWDPAPKDFIVPETGLTITRGLGKLKHTRITQLAAPIETFLEQYQTARPQLTKVQDLLEPLMVVGITALQRMFLKAEALVRYMTEFKPRMVDLGSKSPPPAEHCVGVFTIDPAIAQQFSAAGLPYWLLRPTWTFTTENVLEVVAPRLPADYLMLDPAPDATHFSTKPDTDSKYAVIHKLSSKVPWYKDPFAGTSNPGSSAVSPAAATSSLQDSELCVWKTASSVIPAAAYPPNNYDLRLTPQLLVAPRPPIVSVAALLAAALLTAALLAAALTAALVGLLAAPQLRPQKADALKAVDRSISPSKTDSLYGFPEPALVVSSDNVACRQLFLQNLSLMMDALIYRLGDPDTPHDLLSRGWRADTSIARSIGLHELLAPAFRACGLENEDFTAMPGTAQPITVHRAQEMLGMVAETNFRFELLALDHPDGNAA